MRLQRGFTLIECLVAMMVIAVVLASASRSISLISHDVHDAFVIEVATWVAENEYNQLIIDKKYPDLGKTNKDVSNAGIDFKVIQDVQETQNPYFRKIVMTVQEIGGTGAKYNTVNFISQY